MPAKAPTTSATYVRVAFFTALAVLIACGICAACAFVLIDSVNPLVFAIIGVVLALCIGLLGAYLGSKRYTAAVRELKGRTERFIDGEYGTNFHMEEGTEEVRGLGDDLAAITASTGTALANLRAEEQRQRQFVSDVSHEIRTPLTGIRGNAETMLFDDIPAEDKELFLGSIIKECDRLTRLANDLLALERLESSTDELDFHRIDLRKTVDSVCQMLEPLLEDREVHVSVGGEAPDILGSPDKITQVLVNLIENASRFARGEIRIELLGLRGNSVITVTDDGDGFGDIDPSRLFDRFYRADKSRASATGGTGLGLAIVKSIVTAHDGTVEAMNVPNGGACFMVAIPSLPPT